MENVAALEPAGPSGMMCTLVELKAGDADRGARACWSAQLESNWHL